MCGLIKRDTLEYVDIGFAFLPAYEGKGYGYESAKITVEYAFNKLDLPKLLAMVLENNNRSIKLLEKIGFKYEKHITSNGETLCLYAQSNIQ
jgi:RimJ/RimL family protein N-acetyltransferase